MRSPDKDAAMTVASAEAAVIAEPGPVEIVPLRHWGRWVAAAVLLALVAAIIFGLSRAQINYRNVPTFFSESVMLTGLVHTLLLAIACQALGIVLGTVLATMRVSANPVASWTAWVYIWIFRGVPVLLQLLLWYNLALVVKTITVPGLFSVPTNQIMSPFVAALLGLGLNESAYMAEIVRAGFNSVDKGQIEAAYAIGMTPRKTLRRVILPQAMRVIIPPTGNDFINMLKETSLASVIAYLELVQAATNIYSRNLEVIEALLAAAAWYMILVTLASIGQHYIERAFSPDRRTSAGPGVLSRIQTSLRPSLNRSV
jgi:polar amino acid transport system permease protein